MAGARFKTTIKKDGPWFRHDPVDTFRHNVHAMMVALAEEGSKDVVGQLSQGQGGRQPIRALGDHVSDHIVGELRRAPSGPGYSAWVFVSTRGMSTTEAISTQAAASFLEGTIHAFRRTAGRIGRSRRATAEELLKGLT
jgi:hypothetical protein